MGLKEYFNVPVHNVCGVFVSGFFSHTSGHITRCALPFRHLSLPELLVIVS
jgi:hypothetical protein